MTTYLDVRPSTDKRREKRVEQKAEKIEALLEKAEAKTISKYTVKAILYSRTPYGITQRKWKRGDDIFYQLTARSFNIKAPKNSLEQFYRKHVINEKSDKLWGSIVKVMKTDKNFKEVYARNYIDAVYIMDYDLIPTKGKSRPLDKQLRNQENISIYHRYVETHVDLAYDNLREAIENKNYIENECWLNAITDHYKNLFQHKKITRETILQTINKTEDNIKHGISVNEILPFFETYGIQLRVYDFMGTCIAKYDPETRNHNYKVLYCMVKGDHVYLLNKDI
jgi:hypothetical protein